MKITFKETEEFSKDYKYYFKKYRTLDSDFLLLKKTLSIIPCGNGKHFNIITILNDVKIIKARLACRFLKGSSLRIIYAYKMNQGIVEFIELYYKGDQENENRERIKEYLRNI